MVGLVKDGRTWMTKRAPVIITDYEISQESIYVERSSIYVMEGAGISEGDYLIITDLDYTGIIAQIAPQQNSSVVELRTEPMRQLFYRNLILPDVSALALINTAGQGVEGFIANRIEAEFKNNPDTQYAMPWLSVAAESATVSSMTVDNENNIYTLTSFMAKAQRLHNIKVRFEPHNLTLGVRVYRDSADYRLIDLSRPDIKTEEETYSYDTVARVDVYCQETAATTAYYLLADGTVTTTPGSTQRATGQYEAMAVDTADKVDEAARDVFAKNSYSHLIEFSRLGGLVGLGLYDRVSLRTKTGRILTSYVSGINVSSKTRAVVYKTGELRTSLRSRIASKYE